MDDDPSPANPARARRDGLDVRVSSTAGRLPLGRARVAAIARRVLEGERVRGALLTITFVGDREMAHLNWRHLRHRGATDILTFEHARTVAGAPAVGDIVIAVDVARRNAQTEGCSWREEIARLTVHGVLHALGWEHPEGATRLRSPMWRRQERWVTRLRKEGAW